MRRKDINLLYSLTQATKKKSSSNIMVVLGVLVLAVIGVMVFLFVDAKGEVSDNEALIKDLDSKLSGSLLLGNLQRKYDAMKAAYESDIADVIAEIAPSEYAGQSGKMSAALLDILMLTDEENEEDSGYDAVYCVYDVDNKPFEKKSSYREVREGLKKVLALEARIDSISICTNPNALLLFLVGADSLEKISRDISGVKARDTAVVHRYWDEIGRSEEKKYKAAKWQLQTMKTSYEWKYAYDDMLKNAEGLSMDYVHESPASNVLPLLRSLKDGNLAFFKRARNIKEGK